MAWSGSWRAAVCGLLFCSLVNVACQDAAEVPEEEVAAGGELGPCYGNGTCDDGLTCASGVCVVVEQPADMSAVGADEDMKAPVVAPDMSAPAPEDMPAAAPDMRAEAEPDMGGEPEPDMMAPAPFEVIMESEPNDGAMLDEVNTISAGQAAQGAIGSPGDSDIFEIAAAPGKVYSVRLLAPDGSAIDGSITVIDAGRDGDAPGGDFVKLGADPDDASASVDFLAMGQGGYFIAVRDARDVGVDTPTQGSPGHTYRVEVTEHEPDGFFGPAILPPQMISSELPSASGVQLYPFMATEGQDFTADLRAASAQMDARLIVFSASAGDWIARNGDRAAAVADPLIDAPLFGAGLMYLVVENVEPDAAVLGYDLSVTLQ